jgi:hypothetical protein
MAYKPLAPTIALPPHVKRLMWKLERHYLTPAHALFRLPIPNYRIEGQFHFTIANVLLSAVAGLSTTLYAQAGGNGSRFRWLLEHYYPFADEPASAPSKHETAATLWSVFRNPLAHDLGFDIEKKSKTPETKYLRKLTSSNRGVRGLTERMIERLEDHSARPSPTATVQIRADATVLYVDIFYWGVRRMAESLFSDSGRVSQAETFLATL